MLKTIRYCGIYPIFILIRKKDVKLTENIEEFIEFTIDYFDMIKK